MGNNDQKEASFTVQNEGMNVSHPEKWKKSYGIPDERMVKDCEIIKTPKTIKLDTVQEQGWDVSKWKQATLRPSSRDFYRQKYDEGSRQFAAQWAAYRETRQNQSTILQKMVMVGQVLLRI